MTSGVTAISTGYDHTCAVIGGAAKCWGNNTRGQLGNGMTTLRLTPIDVVGMQGDSSVDLSIDSITPVQALESQAFVKDKRTALKVVVRKRGDGSAKGVTARVAYNSNFYTDFCVAEGDNIDQTTHTLKKNYAGCSCQANTGSASLLVTSCCLWWLKTPSVRNLTPTGR
ncbi:MAG: RCC1 domain-containing protein [Chloroflexi bacterium]|nr:RCC1 domain-containing protein [Chloroflexota bacterium]